MDSALVCLAILFALLMPILALQWWVARPPSRAATAPFLKPPRLSYVPPAPSAGLGSHPVRNRPAPVWPPASRPIGTPLARPGPAPQTPARTQAPLAPQAGHAALNGPRARIVRLSADADPGQRGFWLKYLVEHDGIFFN